MKKVARFSTLAFAVSLLFGCASSSDVDSLQVQIDGLKTVAVKAGSEAAKAKKSAINAASRAAVAEAATIYAAQVAEEILSKLSYSGCNYNRRID